jgi:hypothetical protein
MHSSLITHERRGHWARHLRPRVADWPVHLIETRSGDELAAACERTACPIVVLDPGGRLQAALLDLDRAIMSAPNSLILVFEPAKSPGLAAFAREVGATLVLPAITPPPRVVDLLARWLPLARSRSEADGWAEDRRPEPAVWDHLLDAIPVY